VLTHEPRRALLAAYAQASPPTIKAALAPLPTAASPGGLRWPCTHTSFSSHMCVAGATARTECQVCPPARGCRGLLCEASELTSEFAPPNTRSFQL
jgi:hypothetical protein